MKAFCFWMMMLWGTGMAVGEEPARSGGDGRLRGWGSVVDALSGGRVGNQIFYFPTRDVPATPKEWGYVFEDVGFKSKDGTPLHGWFVPKRAKAGALKATVVFSHGNGGSIGHHLWLCLWFADEGFNVLTYDYRGFGRSGGTVDRRGMVDDVRAAFDYVLSRKDTGPNLVSIGHSLGGSKSLVALAEGPVKGLRAVVTEAAFASYQGMARVIGGGFGAGLVTDEWAPKDWVGKIAPLPLLIVHGSDDEVVPLAQGEELFAAAKQPKTMWTVKGGGHGNALAGNKGVYRKKLLEWLDARLKDQTSNMQSP